MTTTRNPADTRQKILAAAFQEIHRQGYQGMRVDRVLSKTGLKKGALYHHFCSKQALGFAVLDKLIAKRIAELWIEPLQDCTDPLQDIHDLYERLGNICGEEFFTLGCPLNNLAQEMSPIDDGFRERIGRIFQSWQQALSKALQAGQERGLVDKGIDAEDCATFILSAVEGALGMTKTRQDMAVYYRCGRELQRYLNSLRAIHPAGTKPDSGG